MTNHSVLVEADSTVPGALWAGRVLSAPAVLFLLFDTVRKLFPLRSYERFFGAPMIPRDFASLIIRSRQGREIGERHVQSDDVR
jgi:hypothetical protein